MIKKWVTRLILFLGLILLWYPMINGIVQRQHQQDAVSTYKSSVQGTDQNKELEKAQEYNNMLYQSGGAVVDNMDTGILSDDSYNSILGVTDGIMGSIEIPKIDVELPIYHGTSDEVLEIGVGHLQGTSLPIGGENTHSVLTGHRGLPGAQLFTRLDELNIGDLVFLNVAGEVLAYKAVQIETVLPSEVDSLVIQDGKDLLSLVTCTPYGLNTHRLIVTCERVDYEQAEYESIEPTIPSIRELIFAVLPVLVILAGLIYKIIDWRKNRYV